MMKKMVKMAAIQWLVVLWIAHYSHGFVVQRHIAKISIQNGPLWAENKNTPKRENPSASSSSFVMPSSKNSTADVSPLTKSSSRVSNETNAVLNVDDSIAPPAANKKPLTPVEKANLALATQAAAVNATKSDSNGKADDKKNPPSAKASNFSNAGIGVMAPPPRKQPESSIYNRPEVPPLEQFPSKEKAPKAAKNIKSTSNISENATTSKVLEEMTSPAVFKKDTAKASPQDDKTVSTTKVEPKDKGTQAKTTPIFTNKTLVTATKKETKGPSIEPVKSSVAGAKSSATNGPSTKITEDSHKATAKVTDETAAKAAFNSVSNDKVKDKQETDLSSDETPSVTNEKGESKSTAKLETKDAPPSNPIPTSVSPTDPSTKSTFIAAPAKGNVSGTKANVKTSPAASVGKDEKKPLTKLEIKDVPSFDPISRSTASKSASSTKAALIAAPDGSVQDMLAENEAMDETNTLSKADNTARVSRNGAPLKESVATEAKKAVGSYAETKGKGTRAKLDAPQVMASKNAGAAIPIPPKATAVPTPTVKPVEDTKSTLASPSTKVVAKATTGTDQPIPTDTTPKKQDDVSSKPSSKAEVKGTLMDASNPPMEPFTTSKSVTTPQTTPAASPPTVKQAKSGLEALQDLFFGTSEASKQEDIAILKRIRERKQEEVDESESLSEQLNATKNELEVVKKESEQVIAEIRAEAEENELQWRTQVNEMAVKLEVAENMNERSRAKMQEMMVKQVELDSEAKEWKELYANDSPLWVAKYERERDYRRQEQIEARERLSQVMKDSAEKLALAREESRKREDMIRADLTRVLEQNQRTLSYTTAELKQAKAALIAQDEKIEELGDDRNSFRQLAGEALNLIKERTKKRWNMLKNRIDKRKRKAKKV